jgi:hypothetical protein
MDTKKKNPLPAATSRGRASLGLLEMRPNARPPGLLPLPSWLQMMPNPCADRSIESKVPCTCGHRRLPAPGQPRLCHRRERSSRDMMTTTRGGSARSKPRPNHWSKDPGQPGPPRTFFLWCKADAQRDRSDAEARIDRRDARTRQIVAGGADGPLHLDRPRSAIKMTQVLTFTPRTGGGDCIRKKAHEWICAGPFLAPKPTCTPRTHHQTGTHCCARVHGPRAERLRPRHLAGHVVGQLASPCQESAGRGEPGAAVS